MHRPDAEAGGHPPFLKKRCVINLREIFQCTPSVPKIYVVEDYSSTSPALIVYNSRCEIYGSKFILVIFLLLPGFTSFMEVVQ